MTVTTLNITALGGMGDGVGHDPNGRAVFVPYTCAGDRAEVTIEAGSANPARGQVQKILTPSPDRIAPPCSHFGACGGCQLQHVSAPAYAAFKRDRLVQTLRGLRLDESLVAPLIHVPPHSRRRAEFAVNAAKDGSVTLGFSEARSHRIVDVQHCPVLLPEIENLLPPLRQLISALRKSGIAERVHITATDAGMDVLLRVKSRPSASDLAVLKSANLPALARFCLQVADGGIEVLATLQPVTLTIAGIPVTVPAGTFLQATAESQNAMRDLVLEATANAKKVMDLYAGSGTYSLPLLMAGKTVHAVEGSQEMVAALHNAARKAAPDRIHSSVRDLYRTPVLADELNHYDAIVINPPRNGALPQAEQLAKSSVKTIVMVSCNPATFGRDAAALLKGGYHLTRATPIDQFLWSHHLELVAQFERR